jgi:hypothetical protein
MSNAPMMFTKKNMYSGSTSDASTVIEAAGDSLLRLTARRSKSFVFLIIFLVLISNLIFLSKKAITGCSKCC